MRRNGDGDGLPAPTWPAAPVMTQVVSALAAGEMLAAVERAGEREARRGMPTASEGLQNFAEV